jgi:hypothetical protein
MDGTTHHLVHANIAIMRAPLDDPIMAEFVAQADEIDTLAQGSPGFVSQPIPEDKGAVFSGRTMLNLSIWESVESLERFTHQGLHAKALERQADWFLQSDNPNYVLYWALVGDLPTEREVKERLDYLEENGPTPYAFTFERSFPIQEMLAFNPWGK